MKLWEILRYHLRFQLTRFTTAVYAAGLIVITVLAVTTFFDDVVRDGILLNAPMVTIASTIIVTMTGVLVTAALAGESATRDINARVEPLLYTTPLNKRTYLTARFLAAFAVNTLLLTVAPVTLAVWSVVPLGESASFGPFRLAPYVTAFLLFAVPNAFISTAILFALAVLTRSAMAGYLGAAVLFFNSAIQEGIVAGVMKKWTLAKHLDLFGFIIGAAQWRSRTPLQKNTLPLELESALITNRLLWLVVSLLALTVAFARFRMEHHAGAGRALFRRRSAAFVHGENDGSATAALAPLGVRGSFGFEAWLRAAVSIALRSFREIITSRAALLVVGTAWLVWDVAPELLAFGLATPGRPNTGRLALLYGQFNMSGIAVGALLAFFSGQLVWREREAREHDIADASPVPDGVVLAGKFGGLVLLLIVVQGVLMATGIATQLSAGHHRFEPWLWLRVLFGLKLADYILFAALAMAIQVIVNQRYVATALVLLAFAFPQYAEALRIEHVLLIYGSDPGLKYSDFSGFGASFGPWLWLKLYWGGWALLAALLARLLWVRGHDRRTLRLLRERFTRSAIAVTAVAALLIAGAGGFVFYNTNILNEYVTDDMAARRSAAYERRYGRYADLRQPLVAATQLRVELYPSRRTADISGWYRLENRSGGAIDTIHIVTRTTPPAPDLKFDRPAHATHIDARLGYHIYTLETPLAAGESMRMDFRIRMGGRGFANGGVATALASNGTLLEHRPDSGGRTWLPAIGYRRGVELDNPGVRRLHGLPPRPALASVDDARAKFDQRGLENIQLETIIGTDADQIAVAPGTLRRSWSERGRRYFHYATDTPIRNGFPILSARYAVHRSEWQAGPGSGKVAIEVLHHPEHRWNVERFARAAHASLDVYSRTYGPYPHRQLRLVEFPITGGTRLTGHPATVIWSEAIAFADPEKSPAKIDFPFAVMAHEVAHQWWGNQVVPARVDGAPLLSESLAWYSAMDVVAGSHGEDHRDRVLESMREAYLTPHQTPEVPLLRANDWLATYRTGALAMFTIREAIGADRVNTALRRLVVAHPPALPPFPTSLDLYRELQQVTLPETRPLLRDLFEEITFWDLRMKGMNVAPDGRGSHHVTLDVECHKVKVDGAGRERRVAMDDLAEIALYASGEGGGEGALLYRGSHRVRAGQQLITIRVSHLPARARINPAGRLLDRKRDDDEILRPAS